MLKRGELNVFFAEPVGWLIVMWLFVVCPMSAYAQSNHPVTILDIEARCFEPARDGGGATSNTPYHANLLAGYTFHLNFTLYIPDITSWHDSSFAVAGSMPDGVPFRTSVRREDLSRTGVGHYWFAIEVNVMKLGWAHFVLTPDSAGIRPSPDEHSTLSAGKYVDLQCPDKQDTGN